MCYYTAALAVRPCEPSGPPSAGSADPVGAGVKRALSPSLSVVSTDAPAPAYAHVKKQMNVHAPAFLPSVPDNSEL